MSSILTSNLKLIRAKHHLDTLDPSIRKFRAEPERHQRITSYDDAVNGWFLIRNEALNEDDLFAFGLNAGDFICNLRSALDHLAWNLALLKNRFPRKKICFPIFGEDTLDAQLKITESTFGIPEEAIAIMKSLQPYHSGDAYRSAHLWRLHFLWNTDKHRNIVLGGSMSGEVLKLPPDLDKRVQWHPFDNGTEMRIPLSEKHRIMKFDPRPGIDVFFGDITSENRQEWVMLKLEDLIAIYEFVSKEVLPLFERFFPQ